MTDIQMTPELKSEKDKWSPLYKICCTASREFKDREVVFGGVGNSFLAVAIAKLVYAPNMILVSEAGYVGIAGISSMNSPSDNVGGVMATCHQGLFDLFRDQQSGLIDSACLGYAQMDRFGNVGVTYVRPNVRMNGSGGGSDIASSSRSIVYIAEYHPRQFTEKVDYITNPGFIDGSSGAREKAGLVGGGPKAVVTDRGVFRFDPETHEIYLSEVFPWQDEEDINEVVKAFPWTLKRAKDLKIIQPPTDDEVNAVALMDPQYRYRISATMDRPSGKIVLSGKRDINSYRTLAELDRVSWQHAMEILI